MNIWDGMKDQSGMPVALRSLSWEGEARGLLLTMKTVQSYRNESPKTIEAVYTFPLAWEATVDSFAVIRDGVRHVAKAMEKRQAESRYEETLEKGEAPAMLEYNSMGLCTVNVGRIEPGESLEVEIGFTKLLEWRGGEVRITVPTVIGNRYSRDGSQGGLLPHQQVETSVSASYPVHATFRLSGGLERARISVPGQNSSVQVSEDAAIVTVSGGFADRDLVITAQTGALPPSAIAAPDGKGWAVIATGYAPAAKETAPLRLKLLVDCSGSMSGRPIEQARDALRAIGSVLSEDDQVSLTCFGSEAKNMTGRKLLSATKRFMRQTLNPAIEEVEADMGGTEMLAGLEKAIAVQGDGDILIITDGDIWEAEKMIEAAKRCAHRIFLIGVGTSPAGNLLERIARETGGSCTTVMPFEDMSEAVFRMADRMRQAKVPAPALGWGNTPQWKSALPETLFASESWSACAVLPERPGKALTVDGAALPVTFCDDPAIGRFVADRRTKSMSAGGERTRIALEHGLLGPDTNLILVMEGKGSAEMPTLAKVPQMADFCQSNAMSGSGARVLRHSVRMSCSMMPMGAACCKAQMVEWSDALEEDMAALSIESPSELFDCVNREARDLGRGSTAEGILQRYGGASALPWPAGTSCRRYLARTRCRSLLAVLLDWLAETVPGLPPLDAEVLRFVATELKKLTPEGIEAIRLALAAFLPEELCRETES